MLIQQQNFFTNTKSWLAEAGVTNGVKTLSLDGTKPAAGLLSDLKQAKSDVQAALANSFDTPKAMLVILKLVNTTNIFIKDNKDFDVVEAGAIAKWITKMVGIFGLDANATPPYDGLGWTSTISKDMDPTAAAAPYAEMLAEVKDRVVSLALSNETLASLLKENSSAEVQSIIEKGSRDIEQITLPYLRTVSQIRDELRRVISTQTAETKKAILALTDRIRDEDFTNLGVYLDDRSDNQPSLIKFIPAAELIAAREEKKAKEAERLNKKEEARIARELAEQAAKEKAKIPPEEMFKNDERYSAWDEQGLPTKMKDGSDVPKNQVKAAKKLWDKQKKAYDDLKAKGEL